MAAGPSTADVVPGTVWRLEDADSWTEVQRAQIAEAAELLPEDYTHPDTTAVLHIDEAPRFADGSSHALARIATLTPDITLRVRGLPERIGEAAEAAGLASRVGGAELAAAYLLKRALVHELTHLVDRRRHLSVRSDWLNLSGWGILSLVPTPHPLSASGDFAAPWGAHSPAEDLATLAEVYFLPPPLGPHDADLAPLCRFPTKFQWIREHLAPHAPPTPHVRCSAPDDVGLAAASVGDIQILWAAPTLASIAAIGGHLLVAVESGLPFNPHWEVFGLLANSGSTRVGSAQFALLGLTGGFPSQTIRGAFETTRYRYVEGEHRNLLRYRMLLSVEEKERVLTRLDDISQHWRRPYLFFQQNCSALIAELANAVEATPLRPPPVVPPDLVLAELARRGRVEPVPTDPGRDLAPATQALLLQPARTAIARSVCGRSIPALDAVDDDARGRAYELATERAASIDTSDCWAEFALLVALSAPLESAHRPPITPGTTPIDLQPSAADTGLSSALSTLRSHADASGRELAWASKADTLDQAWSSSRPASPSSLHTPYGPLTAGILADIYDTAPTPRIFVRRQAIDLLRTEPRQFGPAKGVDARALATGIAVSPTPTPSASIESELLAAAWHPAPLTARPVPGIAVDVLSGRVDADVARAWAWARWLGASGGLTLGASASGASALDAWLGVESRTTFSLVDGMVSGRTWFLAPLRLAVSAHPSRGGLGFSAETTFLPGIDTAGESTLALESAARGWIYLGEAWRNGVSLELGGQLPWVFAGDLSVPPARAELGLRLERW